MKRNVKTLTGITPDTIPYAELFASDQPVLLKGLVDKWPLVKVSKQGGYQQVMSNLLQHDSQQPLVVYQGNHEISAKFGYNAQCDGFNFSSHTSNIETVFKHITAQISESRHDYMYINSLRLDHGFPALVDSHSLNFTHPEFSHNQPVAKIWLGTESVAAAHFDLPKNIACCVHGRRRFTLFAPEQIENLYPGPLSPTPGGQVVTMADLSNPDFVRFPRLKEALKNAYQVDLQPGDGLYYPSMWWHQVEAYDRFNAMINFWWMTSPSHMGNPMDVLIHGMLSLRDRPENEKAAWKTLFDYYVFGDRDSVTQHIPPKSQGALGSIDDAQARRIRAMLLNNLNK